MKNYIVKENKMDFIKEYYQKGYYLKAKYADGKEGAFEDLETNRKYLDDKMLQQHKNYNYNLVFSFSLKDLLYTVPSSYIVSFLVFYDEITKGTDFDDSLLSSGITGTFLAIITTALVAATRATKAENDYEKDKLFTHNLELIKEKLEDKDFCNKLPKQVRKKVIDIKENGKSLTINTMNAFNLRDMEKLVWECDKKKRKIRSL